MALTAEWFDETQSIILYRFEGRWTWDELYNLIQQANAMTATVQHGVYTIVDFMQNEHLPLGALTHMRSATLRAPDNWQGAVFVGTNSFVRTMLDMFTRLNPGIGSRYRSAKTVEEARSMIEAMQQAAQSAAR